jgi:hypothetical protein
LCPVLHQHATRHRLIGLPLYRRPVPGLSEARSGPGVSLSEGRDGAVSIYTSTRATAHMISSSQAIPPSTRSGHRNRHALISICLAVIIGLLAVGLARPTLAAPLHPPDIHSGTPHRAAGSAMESAEPFLIGPTPLVMPGRGRVTPDHGPHPGSVTVAPPDHPPR